LNRAYYGAHHVALGFKFSTVPQVYGDLLSAVSPLATGIAMTAAIMMAVVWRKAPVAAAAAKGAEENPARERVLIAGLLGLPFIAFFFALVTHAPMASRYILPGVLGVSLGFGYALARMPKQASLIFAVAICSVVGVAELHFWRFVGSERRDLARNSATTVKILEDAGHPALPIVVPNGYILWVAHYAFPLAPQRLVYLTKDPGGAVDTPDKSLAVAQRYVPVQVHVVSEFISENSRFLIFIEGDYSPDQWVTLRVLREGWQVSLVAADGFRAVYLAQKPAAATSMPAQ